MEETEEKFGVNTVIDAQSTSTGQGIAGVVNVEKKMDEIKKNVDERGTNDNQNVLTEEKVTAPLEFQFHDEGRKEKFQVSPVSDKQAKLTKEIASEKHSTILEDNNLTCVMEDDNKTKEDKEKCEVSGICSNRRDSREEKHKAVKELECKDEGRKEKANFEEPGRSDSEVNPSEEIATGTHKLENEQLCSSTPGDDKIIQKMEENFLELHSLKHGVKILQRDLDKTTQALNSTFSYEAQLSRGTLNPECLASLTEDRNRLIQWTSDIEQMIENMKTALETIEENQRELLESINQL